MMGKKIFLIYYWNLFLILFRFHFEKVFIGMPT